MRLLENLLRKWGGALDLFFACSPEGVVTPWFWQLLRLHDADRFGSYVPTWRGLEIAAPEEFDEWVRREAARLAGEAEDRGPEDMERLLREENVLSHPRWNWTPPDRLVHEILMHMSPFHWQKDVFTEHVGDDWVPGYHFVDMALLEPVNEEAIETIDASALDQGIQILLAMRVGALSPGYRRMLETLGIEIKETLVNDRNLADFLQFAWLGSGSRTSFFGGDPLTRAQTPLGRRLRSLPSSPRLGREALRDRRWRFGR